MIDTQLRDLARGIAAHLDGFRATADDRYGHRVWLDHPDGRRLALGQARWNKPDRVEISGEFPASDYHFGTGERPSITVSRTRDPSAIAKDIIRRLMPAYLEILGKVRTRIAEKAAHDTHRADLAGSLAALVPGAGVRTGRTDNHTAVHWHAASHGPDLDREDPERLGYGHIELYGSATSATVEIHNIGIGALQRLVAALGVPTLGVGSPASTKEGRVRDAR